ncbi:MAG TPA: GNAT family N-acetyltransferase [Anaerolineales bacterium]|nr:GNAT family N-acetyltransferase [Anaerolineales bacterium]
MVSTKNDPRRIGTIWVFDLDQPIPLVNPRIGVSFSRVDSESITKLAALIGENSSADILKRFESGRRCYVAQVDEQLAAYGWVSFAEEFVGELSLHLKLLPGEAYIWDCVTLPAFRRNHLYSALLTYILLDLRAESLHRVWIGADLDNIASQRGIARAGFKAVADMVLGRVEAQRQIWVQGRPDVPESLVAEARRVYLNNRDKVWLDAQPSALRG